MDTNKLIQIIEAEVKRALTEESKPIPANKKKILALFTGGHVKLQESLSQIEILLREGYHIDAVLSEAAVSIVTPDRIRRIQGIGEIICEPASLIASIDLTRKSDIIIVPILTRNTAAKVALGIADTLVTNIIMHALIAGKPVIAARNSADPDQADCYCISTADTPPELSKLARNYLQKLVSYNVQLLDAAEISQYVISIRNDNSAATEQKLITQDIISKLPQDTKQVKLAKGSIITPLAKDIARERGIEIILG